MAHLPLAWTLISNDGLERGRAGTSRAPWHALPIFQHAKQAAARPAPTEPDTTCGNRVNLTSEQQQESQSPEGMQPRDKKAREPNKAAE